MKLPDAPLPGRTLPRLRMSGIGKCFGGVRVLTDVRFELTPGEVHVLAGENGAGKSTLIKILAGVYPDFEGFVEIDGMPAHSRSPQEANTRGVAVIFQELSLIPTMTVADNIFLGRNPNRAGFVIESQQVGQARSLLEDLGISIDVCRKVEELTLAEKQLVEIAKALSRDAHILVMDEPTSALNAPEVDKLFDLIARLKERGCSIIYITHKMEEIGRIADRITVLRDGRWVGTAPVKDLDPIRLIEWMVGRDWDHQLPRTRAPGKEECLRLEHFAIRSPRAGEPPVVEVPSLRVHQGEILGLAGLQGSGASELLMGLFGGWKPGTEGKALLRGNPLNLDSPRQAIDQGIALLTNDRKTTGLVLSLSVVANATLASLPSFSPRGWLRPERERRATTLLGETLSLQTASLDREVETLSGGNQQKVVLAKWLQTGPQLLLLDEPTRGIDVGAKREIYTLLNQLTARGISILLITSELPELLGLSDRIVVLRQGRPVAELNREDVSPATILETAMGNLRK